MFTKDEQLCADFFIENTIRLESGRFQVETPLRESPVALGDSFLLLLLGTCRNQFIINLKHIETINIPRLVLYTEAVALLRGCVSKCICNLHLCSMHQQK